MIKKRRKHINKKIYIRRTRCVSKKGYTSFIVPIIMIVVSIIFVKLGLEVEKNINPIYQYQIERKSDYEVLLNENDFYSTKTLPADLCYASKSINAFIINFEYNFKAKNKIDTEYDYSITADLVGVVKDEYKDKEVWNKSFSILENKTIKQVNIDSFSIKEKVDIDYKKYNDLVQSYENTYGIKINAVLKVHFNISYQMYLSNYNINTEKKRGFN